MSDALRAIVAEAADVIDAAIFSGDLLESQDERMALRAILARWTRAMDHAAHRLAMEAAPPDPLQKGGPLLGNRDALDLEKQRAIMGDPMAGTSMSGPLVPEPEHRPIERGVAADLPSVRAERKRRIDALKRQIEIAGDPMAGTSMSGPISGSGAAQAIRDAFGPVELGHIPPPPEPASPLKIRRDAKHPIEAHCECPHCGAVYRTRDIAEIEQDGQCHGDGSPRRDVICDRCGRLVPIGGYKAIDWSKVEAEPPAEPESDE